MDKIAVLGFVLQNQPVTYDEMAEGEYVTLDESARSLLRNYRRGYLSRHKDGRKYHYLITQRGIDYLRWVVEQGE